MVSYCAFLRGIGPGKPGNDALRKCFEGLGLEGVSTVLSSGNVLFSTESSDSPEVLEERIQRALQQQCRIGGGTILRSRQELAELMERRPFGGLSHSKETYLTVTFLKQPLAAVSETPDPPEEAIPHVRVLGYDHASRALLAVVDQTQAKAADYMVWLQSRFGTEITTRTWNTLANVRAKLPAQG